MILQMNKRIRISFLAAIFAVSLFITTSFLIIINLQKIDMVKEQLSTQNKLISLFIENGTIDEIKKLDGELESFKYTLISKNGEVLFDNFQPQDMDNQGDREEVKEAFKNGSGFQVRVSETTGEKRIYYASKLKNGDILRSSVVSTALYLGSPLNQAVLVVFILSILIAYFLAHRISSYLIEPINEMTFATERMAKGEYSRRVRVRKDIELKHLAMNFNHMAERVENIFIENDEKQNRLEAILKSMNSGVLAIDNDNKIIIINRFCKELFGIKDEIMGKDIYEIKELKELISAMDSDEDQVEVQIKKPVMRHIRMKSAEIYGDLIFKAGTVVVFEDITDMKKLEKMRSQFVANVSHELKTPLTSIKGFSETLKYVEDEETRHKFLDIINEESERLTRLINDILSLSAIEQTRVSRRDRINVVQEMEKIYSLLSPRANTRNITLIFAQKEDLIIRGDQDQFKQMILNLADNALKYTEENGVVTLSLKRSGDFALISVKDTGEGIPKKHLDRIFERFYRVDKSRDRAMGGTGLGLAIVKHIVLSFDGNITVESVMKKGTTFKIYLPLE